MTDGRLARVFADHRHRVRFLHMRVHPVVLPEDAPEHAGARHQKHNGEHVAQHDRMGAGQDADERARGVLLHRVRVQRVVHVRDPGAVHRVARQVRVRQGVRQHHRLHRHAQLLHRLDPAEVRIAPRERRHTRIFLDYPDNAAVQADATLVRAENPHADVPGIGQGADAARVLPGAGHRHIRQPGVLRGAHPGQPAQRLQQHTAGPLVGAGHHDHGRVRRHGAKDVRGHVRRSPVRAGRSAHHRLARARHRQQLRHVLLAHAGSCQATEKTASCAAGRTTTRSQTTGAGRTRPAERGRRRLRRRRRWWRQQQQLPVRRRRWTRAVRGWNAAQRGRSAGQHYWGAGRQPPDERSQKQPSQGRRCSESR